MCSVSLIEIFADERLFIKNRHTRAKEQFQDFFVVFCYLLMKRKLKRLSAKSLFGVTSFTVSLDFKLKNLVKFDFLI